MAKLSLLFDSKQFVATFAAAAGDAASASSQRNIMIWLESGVGVAGPRFA